MSRIEWTDRTWNPTRGCSRVSEGCRNCYAERMAARFSTHAQQEGDEPGGVFASFAEMRDGSPRWTGKVALVPSKLDEPLRWRKPARVFVNSMSDLFHERLADEEIDQPFGVMAIARRHTFQILTKRSERMREYLVKRSRSAQPWKDAARALGYSLDFGGLSLVPFPLPNVHLGVSVEDQATADERIPLLLQTPAAVRFVSYEPALGPVDFGGWLGRAATKCAACGMKFGHDAGVGGTGCRGLDWVIVGGESGPGARPFDVAWARATVNACRAAGVPCFVKQMGARPYEIVVAEKHHLGVDNRKGGDPSEWPEDLRVRQFPRERKGERKEGKG